MTGAGLRLAARAGGLGRGPFTFITWEGLPAGQEQRLRQHGGKGWFLPLLPPEAARRLIEEYCALTSQVGTANGPKSIWWYTWSSSRDRYHSRLLAEMEILERLRLAAGRLPEERTVLLCPDPILAEGIRQLLKEKGIPVSSRIPDRLAWGIRRLQGAFFPWIAGLRVAGRSFLYHIQLMRSRPAIPLPGGRTRVLLVTWLKHADLGGKVPLGTYFGRLPLRLMEKGVETAFFGGLLDTELSIRAAARQEIPVAAGPQWLDWADFPIACAKGLLAPVHLPAEGGLSDRTLRRLLRRDLDENRGKSAVFGLLMERALRRFLRAYRPHRIIHICENNPWERACAAAARSLSPAPELLGYHHCAVVLSHTKILLTEADRKARPRPERLICTGERARALMIRHGGHRPEETLAGCAWRFEYLKSSRPRDSVRWKGGILVILEGLPTMVHLIRFMDEALAGQREVKARFRAHPQYPLGWLLKECALSLSGHPALSETPYKSLAEDMEAADIVVYKGTTAAIEAGTLGIPIIHVETPNLLTDDPLFELSALKRTVRAPEEFIPAVRELTSMSPEEFKRSLAEFRRYVEEYLAPPTEESIAPFLPEPARRVPFAEVRR